jgi:N-acetylglucosaminyl-diphospho-decaprenol L-rhamnosyltransferase
VADSSSLDVVVVSYRCRGLLRECLSALREHAPARPFRVTVVDNASGDGTVEMVRADFPEVRLIASDRNLGFSAANNLAIRGQESDYVLSLNPDTRMTPGSLDHLVDLMDARAEIGICGCRLELEDGSFDHAAKRSFPTVLGALGHFTGVGRKGSALGPLAQYRAPGIEAGPVDAVNGAFMLMRRSTLDAIGLFDEGFWLYMEDLDLCYRCWEAGKVVWFEPSVTVVHVKHGTSGDYRTPRVNYAFHYGMYRFYRKHYAPERNVLVNGAVYAGIAGKLAVSTVRSAFARRVLRTT